LSRKHLIKHLIVILLLFVAAVFGLGFHGPCGERPATLTLPGVVETQEVRLGSKVGGRVAEVAVVEGQVVEAGQVLVRLDVPELRAQCEQQRARLQAQRAQLEKARNGPRREEREAARAALESARARWKRLQSGFRTEEVTQARGELHSAEADLELAVKDHDRAAGLLARQAVGRAEYESYRAARNRAQGRASAARARLDLLLAGTRPEEVQEAAAEVKRAEANWRMLEAGTRSEEIAEAEARLAEIQGRVGELEVNLTEAVVRAPERAVVELVSVRKGDLVTPNQPVVQVLRADDLWVKAYVSEVVLGKVRLNQSAEVRIDAYPGLSFAGQVLQVGSRSEFTPRNVQSLDERRHQVFGVKVRVADSRGVFKSGMAAEVVLPLREVP
jgi:multidrug resistance efflux pump